MGKYIDGSGLSHFMGILKGAFAVKGDAVKNITRSGTTFTATRADGTTFTFDQQDNTVAKTTTTPAMNGTAAIGTETKYAAGDHVHPTDTSRAASSHTHGNITNGGDITATAPTIASGDCLVINDDSASKVTNGPAFGTSTTTFLRNDGTWGTPAGTANQNAFSNVKVGTTTIAADTTTDTLELAAGDNITLTPDATNDKVTIAATDTVYTHPSYTAHSTSAIYKFTNDATGHVNAATAATASDIVTLLGTTAVNRATADASGNNIASTYATKDELSTATAGALQYKGTVDAESTITSASYKKGWYYVVSTAGTYVGKVCEVGDMLIAKQDKTNTPANDWDAVQSNIETLSNSEIDTLWNDATAA